MRAPLSGTAQSYFQHPSRPSRWPDSDALGKPGRAPFLRNIDHLDVSVVFINWTVLISGSLVLAMKPTRVPTLSIPQPTQRQYSPWAPLLVCIGIALAGCGQAPKTAQQETVTGTYALVAVDGNKPPCTLQHQGNSVKIKSGAFTIKADGTCSSRIVFSLPSGEESSKEVSATYTQEGTKLNMQWQGAGKTVGTIEGDNFTMNNEGIVFAYRK